MVTTHFEHALVDLDEPVKNHLESTRYATISHVRTDLEERGYESPYASFLLPNDGAHLAAVEAMLPNFERFTDLVVIGIGGSNLGSLAILDALQGKFRNDLSSKRVHYLDTTDTEYALSLVSVLERSNANGGKIAIAIISKSGSTTETLKLFEFLQAELSAEGIVDHRSIIAITDKGSKLDQLATDNNWHSLHLPKTVGGRYSVFSAVGLFVLGFAGIDLRSLLSGARQALEDGLKNEETVSVSWKEAEYLWDGYNKWRRVADTFVFSNAFEGIGKWYRQLLAESVGKSHDLDGTEVFAGITPTVSVGSTDLHSVGQFYLSGWANTSFMLVRPKTEKSYLHREADFDAILPYIRSKSLEDTMEAIYYWLSQACVKKGIPFTSTVLTAGSAHDIGYLLQSKMLSVVFLAKLLNVNPFDQPNVEDYKVFTKQALWA